MSGKKSDNTIQTLKRAKKIDTKQYTLEQLRKELAFIGNLATFRVLCWNNGIDYKRKRSNVDYFNKLLQLKTEELTLTEIKEAIAYKGSISALNKVLAKAGMKFKKKTTKNNQLKETILDKTKGFDTRQFTPQQIVDIAGVATVNPTSYLRNIKIPYKRKEKK